MKREITDIKSGIGLGILKFGMRQEEVTTLLGEPNETETSSFPSFDEDDATIDTETWHYDELELSLGFDEEENWRLVSIGVTSDNYTLFNKGIIGVSKSELADHLKNNEIDDLVKEELPGEDYPDQELFCSEKLGINFWFDNNELSEIQWAPFMLDDEVIEWP